MNIMISDFLQFSHKFLQILELAVFVKKKFAFTFLVSTYMCTTLIFNTVEYQ